MFHITQVEIEGFWGRYRASANMHADVNIFIGRNGSGKTNFMNLLEGVLRVDLRVLSALEFDMIRVKLKDRQTTRTISVSKSDVPDAPFEILEVKVGRESFRLQYYPSDVERGMLFRRLPRIAVVYEELVSKIKKLVNISSLSVHRAAYETVFEDEVFPSRRIQKPPIDQRLDELIQQLTRYQLTLAERAATISTTFQREVLISMLYDEAFDRFELDEVLGTELSKEKEDLSKAYRELNAWDRNIGRKIDNHVAVLNRSLTNLKQVQGSGDSVAYDSEDVMPLPLLRRTQRIIMLSRNAEQQKQEISKPMTQFLTTLRGFITDKEISISVGGDLVIQKNDRKIEISDLSSGEKQLLILLTETLLQQSKPFVFLADEPELSLHIEWQEKIIDSIRFLNPNAQIVVATHSPEIAGGWKERVIDMQDVIHA